MGIGRLVFHAGRYHAIMCEIFIRIYSGNQDTRKQKPTSQRPKRQAKPSDRGGQEEKGGSGCKCSGCKESDSQESSGKKKGAGEGQSNANTGESKASQALIVATLDREEEQLILLTIMAASSLMAAFWPSDAFFGYSCAIDAALFVFAAYIISSKPVVLLASCAAAYNFSTFASEVALTSNALELNSVAISMLGLFYIHYEHVMVALSVAMLIASIKHGHAATMGTNERRGIDLRHNLKIEIPQ